MLYGVLYALTRGYVKLRLQCKGNLLMQSMVLHIMGLNNHTHLKYFGITNGLCLVSQNLCKFLVFKYVFDFAMGPLLFQLF